MAFEDASIQYGKGKPDNQGSQLQERLDAGKVGLGFDERLGYLQSVLKELKVPPSSQMLVFSKTSFQRERISPKTPRALFFNDDVYVGFIPGSPLMEISV